MVDKVVDEYRQKLLSVSISTYAVRESTQAVVQCASFLPMYADSFAIVGNDPLIDFFDIRPDMYTD